LKHLKSLRLTEAFALIGKVLSLKPINTQVVRHTLAASWSFAVPIAVEPLAHNKFLMGVSDPAHADTILRQAPWNIRGSMLLLKLWSPSWSFAVSIDVEPLAHNKFLLGVKLGT
jgi:hypothetical protein